MPNIIPISDTITFEAMPFEIQQLLRNMNGVTLLDGGLTFYNCTRENVWNALVYAIAGENALYKTYDQLRANDIPFAIDSFGDQYLLRDGQVHHLFAESGALENMDISLFDFIDKVSTDTVEFLNLHPHVRLRQQDKKLGENQLYSVYPPFMMQSEKERAFKAIDAKELIDYQKRLYIQWRDIPDGVNVRIETKNTPDA